MAFVDDREDINSIALTAVSRLLRTYKIDPRAIGRLEIGTESLVDKSKSTKTELMDLFRASGNTDIEGATTLNACYGGTAALFNSAAWAASPEAAGRFAIYVAADIAVYEAGPARPTGGAGAVAVLVGPDAPLALVPGVRTFFCRRKRAPALHLASCTTTSLPPFSRPPAQVRATHASNVYDFYKPTLGSEYPAVDGRLSQMSYISALDACYNGFRGKAAGRVKSSSAGASSDGINALFDFAAFHSPYNKLVQQSFKRMLFLDARAAAAAGRSLPQGLEALAPWASIPVEDTFSNRDLDKALSGIGGAAYAQLVGPTEGLSKAIGNSYAAALHANLLCLAAGKGASLVGKTVGAFSYGSGALATLFALKGRRPTGAHGFSLGGIQSAVDVPARLAARREAEPSELSAALKMREASYGRSGFEPTGSIDNVPAGAFFLKSVKAGGQRVYDVKA